MNYLNLLNDRFDRFNRNSLREFHVIELDDGKFYTGNP